MWTAAEDMERRKEEEPKQPQRSMTRAEAGKKGGLTTKKRYGQGFYRQIGKIGGKKGGEATKEKYGVEFYRDIAKRSRSTSENTPSGSKG